MTDQKQVALPLILQVLKKSGEVFLIAGASFLLFLILFEARLQLPPWMQVLGRMHPLFLHFPIVLLLLYLVTFWLPAKGEWTKNLGLLAALTAIVTAVMGSLLALEEAREGTTFFWHKWGGVAVAFFAFLLYRFHHFFIKKKWLTKPLTIGAAFLLLLTGHWGANLTHGDNFLLAPLATKEAVPLEQATAFQHVVLPIFQQKCITCHNLSNSKGGLALDDTASVLYGGKGGPLYEAGNPENSLLLKRILLPLDDKKHMAPKTKPQLTDEEIQLLQAWVKAGAPIHQKIISLPLQDSFRLLAAQWFSPSSTGDGVVYEFGPADERKVKALNSNHRVITPLHLGSPALSVQFYGRSEYTPKALEELLPIKEQIVELGLAKMPVKDKDLKPLLQFINLRKLNLNYTDVTPQGFQQLTGLKKLTELAVAGTAITAAVANEVVKLPELKALYVWNTGLDSTVIAALQKTKQGLKIEAGYSDNGKTVLPLNLPIAKTASGIYDSATLIELKHPYPGVEIRYTLDGSEPDSVQSAVYTGPLPLEKFTVVKAKAYKKGWYGSQSLKAFYFIKGIKPDSVAYVIKGQKDKGKEALLFDNDIGDLTLGTGAWIEMKQPATFHFFFREPVSVQQLSVNTIVRMEWDIFPVSKMEVWGGMKKEALKKLGTWQEAVPSKLEEADLKQPLVRFPTAELKYMKLVIYPLLSMPRWHTNKGKPSRVFISEVVLNE